MAGKFQLKSARWNRGVAIGCVALVVVAFGGLFLIQGFDPTGGPALLLLLVLGVVTFLFFALPGIVYSLRKRNEPVKKALPGGTMTWVRAHLYIPVLAIVAAYVHATAAPFRATLTSGKVTLLLSALVLMSGWARHHLIGIQKEALNVNVSINKLTIGQPRVFRTLVTDYTENRRPLAEIEADVASLDEPQQRLWAEVKRLGQEVHRYFPREGGQRPGVRHWKVWKALHPPLTILLFVLLGYHVFDVLGGTQAVFGDEKTEFASSQQCASCHSDIHDEWQRSALAHAQTGTIMEAQLPITIGENEALVDELGGEQEDRFDLAAKTCINCHAQVGARFAERQDALFPLGADKSDGEGDGVAVSGGGDAVQSDGVGCITCHTQEAPPEERAGFGELPIETGGAADYGTQYGPLFEDPDPLPVRIHGMEQGDGDWWNDPVSSSTLCGACHNVRVDFDDDGEDDLVLQTTFDEWTEYVGDFDERFEGDDRQTLSGPLGCVDCHMPTEGDGEQASVDYAPGLMPVPDRPHRSHAFVGVDYDLDPDKYKSREEQQEVIEERRKLLASAVTLEVVNQGESEPGVFQSEVRVRNNLLGHSFPTGFAFARQFWLEVSAETADGEPVCLLDIDPAALPSSCTSGALEDPTEELRQCDPVDVAEVLGLSPADVGNTDIEMSETFPADDCDPWLTNFQKILTDGDPDGDGIFEEVPYQSFLPQIVKLRVRTATQEEMAPIDAGANENGVRGFLYEFDTADFPGEEIVVTAQLRFRHLPPYFVRGLADALEARDDVPDEVRIDAEELLANMVIDDLVVASSDEGEQLLCDGPQNGEGVSVLDCDAIDEGGEVDDADGVDAAPAGESPHQVETAGLDLGSPVRRFWLPSLLLALMGALVTRGRVRLRRGR